MKQEVFGNIFYRRKIVLARLEGIQKALSEGGNLFLNKLKKVLTNEYNQILAQVEVYSESGFGIFGISTKNNISHTSGTSIILIMNLQTVLPSIGL